MEISLLVPFENLSIVVRLRIGQHPPRDLTIGDAITLMDAQVGPVLPGSVEVNRALGARRLRNLDDEQRASIDLGPAHIVATQQVGAPLLRVLEKVPEVALDLVDAVVQPIEIAPVWTGFKGAAPILIVFL